MRHPFFLLMAGIYIHIPFCKSRCHYCDFYSTVKLSYKTDFLKALITELSLRKDYLKKQKIKTIYFGGGTPSLLSTDEITQILDKVYNIFPVTENCEITLEANPEDLTDKYIKDLASTPVNRISIGIQTFNDTDLKMLNRRHNATQAIQSIETLKHFGFQNISVDLIYGLPGLLLKDWKKNLSGFLNLEIPHLSAYHLTYEKHTVLGYQLKKKQILPLSETESIDQYKLLCQMMNDHGYLHYEISNFCLPGNISNHNSSYWEDAYYLGLGPAAHSYNGISRQWNQPNLFQYLSGLNKNALPPYEEEILSETNKFNDYILTGLRTAKGINLAKIQNDFPNFLEDTKKKINKLKSFEDLCLFDGSYLKLTEKGFFVSDKIIEDFMVVDYTKPSTK